jgi:uncharacterized protein YoxC
MKTITLPGGRKAHFPDETPPEVIAKTIANLVLKNKAEKKEEPKGPDEHTKAVQGLSGSVDKGMQVIAAQMAASASAVKDLSGKLDNLNDSFRAINQGFQSVQELAKQIQSLEGTVDEAAEKITKTMRAKRKITHVKGRPVSMELEE